MRFVSRIDSSVFITRLPSGVLPRLFLMGALVAGPFSALAVLILGKRSADPVGNERNTRLVMPTGEWAWKLAVIALAYLFLYFTFGYFIAWRNPAVREYYGGVFLSGVLFPMWCRVGKPPLLPSLPLFSPALVVADTLSALRCY